MHALAHEVSPMALRRNDIDGHHCVPKPIEIDCRVFPLPLLALLRHAYIHVHIHTRIYIRVCVFTGNPLVVILYIGIGASLYK